MGLKLTFDRGRQEVPVFFDRFPAGESLVSIESLGSSARCVATIHLNFQGNTDLIDLLLLTDAVRRHWPHPSTEITLDMPYFPYARQDRVCSPGEPLSAKVVADLINTQKYHSVICRDLHSGVSACLINNLVHDDLLECAQRIRLSMKKDTVLVSPDAGANKKVFDFAKRFGFTSVVRADKTRDVATGEITGTVVYSDDIGDRDFLIVDDICDGGRTFIELAKKLRPLTTGKILLYVTHGIFSKGAEVFEGLIDQIYVSNLMGNPHPLIKEI